MTPGAGTRPGTRTGTIHGIPHTGTHGILLMHGTRHTAGTDTQLTAGMVRMDMVRTITLSTTTITLPATDLPAHG